MMFCFHKWQRTGEVYRRISRADNKSVISVTIEQECKKCGKLAYRHVP